MRAMKLTEYETGQVLLMRVKPLGRTYCMREIRKRTEDYQTVPTWVRLHKDRHRAHRLICIDNDTESLRLITSTGLLVRVSPSDVAEIIK